MIYLSLFWEFFKAGLFAIGGGLATLPFLRNIADKTGWFTQATLVDMIAVSESTPGAIGINMATYAGFTTAGLLGGIVATLGLICPSIIVILLVARFLKVYKDNRIVQGAFYGLRPASVGLIASACFYVFQVAILNLDMYNLTKNLLDLVHWSHLALAVVIFIVMKLWKPHPIIVIAASAVVGIIFRFAGA